MAALRFPRSRWLWILVAASLPACFFVRQVNVESVRRTTDSVQVRNPVKAHMIDGSTVVYSQGVLVNRGRLKGAGVRYDLRLGNPVNVDELALDSVVGLESYRTGINAGASFGVSLLATAAAAGVAVGIACAIDPKCFGSCPTYYSDSAGTPVLEAEGFSYSIAPLFEARDVDRLRGRPDSLGVLRLEVRNEAFETHYINQLEVLEVQHHPGEIVVPDYQGAPIVLSRLAQARDARDRTGRQVQDVLAEWDGRTYSTTEAVLGTVAADDLEDWIELSFDIAPRADSAVILLRLRNSLLNTVLLYDMMLGDPGARSLDWQAEHLSRVGPAVELGAWYGANMGLAVETWVDGAWKPVGRIKDTGPVAWKEVAVPVPAGQGRGLRLRLRFPADNWRIDRVSLAQGMRRPEVRAIPVTRVTGLNGAVEAEAFTSVLENDDRYLQTQAGQAFIAEWETGQATPRMERTFLLASQGYYIEWVRQGWLTAARDTTTFKPGDAALLHAIERWRSVQDSLEQRFFATRVPVR